MNDPLNHQRSHFSDGDSCKSLFLKTSRFCFGAPLGKRYLVLFVRNRGRPYWSVCCQLYDMAPTPPESLHFSLHEYPPRLCWSLHPPISGSSTLLDHRLDVCLCVSICFYFGSLVGLCEVCYIIYVLFSESDWVCCSRVVSHCFGFVVLDN